MTDMRDARFQKALQEAPDAGARPAPQLAQAIREAARNALPAPPRPVVVNPWWQRLWQNTGRPSAPWNATFATLLVGVLVTVMWVREPVPDARPFADSAPVPAPVPSPVPAPADAPAALESSRSAAAKISAAPAIAPAPSKMAPPAQAPATATEMATAKETTIATAAAGKAAQPAAPLADQAPAANKATAAVVAEEQSQAARLKKDASTEAQSSRVEMARAAEPAAAPAAAPVMPAAPAAAALAPAPTAQSSADLSGLDAWTAMQIQMQGRSITLDRAQAQKLFAGMVRLARQMRPVRQIGQSPAASRNPTTLPATEPVLRLTVVSQAQPQAVMVLWDDTVLWQRPTKDDVIASATAANIQALLQLARQSIGTDLPD